MTMSAEVTDVSSIQDEDLLRRMVSDHSRKLQVKSKVHSRTGHEGPEGGEMYSSTLPSTSALDGGGWSTPHPGRFTPGKDPVRIV